MLAIPFILIFSILLFPVLIRLVGLEGISKKDSLKIVFLWVITSWLIWKIVGGLMDEISLPWSHDTHVYYFVVALPVGIVSFFLLHFIINKLSSRISLAKTLTIFIPMYFVSIIIAQLVLYAFLTVILPNDNGEGICQALGGTKESCQQQINNSSNSY